MTWTLARRQRSIIGAWPRGHSTINRSNSERFSVSRVLAQYGVVERYLSTGVIGADDVRLIAIGAGRFGAYVTEYPLPLIMSSVFPIGDEFVLINTDTGEVVDRGFHPSLEITRAGGSIPRTAFVDDLFAHISGILWSRSSIGNLRHEQRPLTFVHNPRATIKMAKACGLWDREFVTTEHQDQWLAKDILAPDPT